MIIQILVCVCLVVVTQATALAVPAALAAAAQRPKLSQVVNVRAVDDKSASISDPEEDEIVGVLIDLMPTFADLLEQTNTSINVGVLEDAVDIIKMFIPFMHKATEIQAKRKGQEVSKDTKQTLNKIERLMPTIIQGLGLLAKNTPTVNREQFDLPLPDFTLSEINFSDIKIPAINIPEVKIPEIPKFQFPEAQIPQKIVTSLSDQQELVSNPPRKLAPQPTYFANRESMQPVLGFPGVPVATVRPISESIDTSVSSSVGGRPRRPTPPAAAIRRPVLFKDSVPAPSQIHETRLNPPRISGVHPSNVVVLPGGGFFYVQSSHG